MIAGDKPIVHQQITENNNPNQSRLPTLPFEGAFLMFERLLADLNSAGGRLVLLFLLFLYSSIGSVFGNPVGKTGAAAALFTLLSVLRRTDSPRGSQIVDVIVSLAKSFQRREGATPPLPQAGQSTRG
jgi:hypothetical protein